jgi:hypothetical protein
MVGTTHAVPFESVFHLPQWSFVCLIWQRLSVATAF